METVSTRTGQRGDSRLEVFIANGCLGTRESGIPRSWANGGDKRARDVVACCRRRFESPQSTGQQQVTHDFSDKGTVLQ